MIVYVTVYVIVYVTACVTCLGMLKSVKKSDIVKLYVYRMEQVMKACEEESKKVFCVI